MRAEDLTKEQQEAIKSAKAAHGKIGAFTTDAGDLVLCRRCSPMERIRYITEAGKRKEDPNLADANKSMALGATVYPEDTEAKLDVYKRFPALIDDVAAKAYELAGGTEVDLGND